MPRGEPAPLESRDVLRTDLLCSPRLTHSLFTYRLLLPSAKLYEYSGLSSPDPKQYSQALRSRHSLSLSLSPSLSSGIGTRITMQLYKMGIKSALPAKFSLFVAWISWDFWQLRAKGNRSKRRESLLARIWAKLTTCSSCLMRFFFFFFLTSSLSTHSLFSNYYYPLYPNLNYSKLFVRFVFPIQFVSFHFVSFYFLSFCLSLSLSLSLSYQAHPITPIFYIARFSEIQVKKKFIPDTCSSVTRFQKLQNSTCTIYKRILLQWFTILSLNLF